MKSLIALFSAEKVDASIASLNADRLSSSDLLQIRGGGEPVIVEHNIVVPD